MAYQTTYNERIAPPQPGVLAGNVDNARLDTGIAETASPGIPFGRAVSQGSLSDAGVILGGTVAGFRGVSIRDITLRGDATPADAYLPPSNVAICSAGQIWAEPNSAVAANDPVWFHGTTGLLGNATGTGMVGPVKGARWKTSCGIGGRAIAEFPQSKVNA